MTTFVTGVIAHATDLAELHHNKLRYERRTRKNFSLPNEVVVPSIFVKLSDVLPTAANRALQSLTNGEQPRSTPHLDSGAAKDGSSQSPESKENHGAGAISTWLSESRRRSPGFGKPWAMDYIELRYSGVHSVQTREGTGARHLTYGMDAIIRVVDRKKFSLLSGKLGDNVYYNSRRGEFCVRLRTKVGSSIVSTLKARLQAIDRVVNSLDAMSVAKDTVKCEQVTLDKVVFTYSDGSGAEGAKRWRVSLDVSKDRMVMDLEIGNPHIRILDHLSSLLNAPNGISNLTLVLPMTLNILTVLDKLHNNWKEIAKRGKGTLIINAKSLDWYTLCYEMPEAPNRPRALGIDVRAKLRNGKLWWFITRADPPAPGQEQNDFFNQRLRKVWEAKNVPWRSLSSGAAMDIDDKSLKLLFGLDHMVREAVIGGGGSGANAGANNAQAAGKLSAAQAAAASAVGSRAKPVTLD